jgi:hypothetical protein
MEDTMYQQLLNFYAAKESVKKISRKRLHHHRRGTKDKCEPKVRQLAKLYSLHEGLLVHNANGKRLQVLQRLADWNRC